MALPFHKREGSGMVLLLELFFFLCTVTVSSLSLVDFSMLAQYIRRHLPPLERIHCTDVDC